MVDGACAIRRFAFALALCLGVSAPAVALAPAVVPAAGRAVGGFPLPAPPFAALFGPGISFEIPGGPGSAFGVAVLGSPPVVRSAVGSPWAPGYFAACFSFFLVISHWRFIDFGTCIGIAASSQKRPRGPFKGPRNPFKGPRNPFKGPRGTLKGPRGPFKGPRGPFKDPGIL